MVLLHELGHSLGCLSGTADCEVGFRNQFRGGYEQDTTDDVARHTSAIKNVAQRPRYDTGGSYPGGSTELSGGTVEIPNEDQLKTGNATP
jgi:hypothetical protein